MDALRTLVARLEGVIRANEAVNVNSAESKKIVLDGTQEYFDSLRPLLLAQGADPNAVSDFDGHWKHLAELAHSNNAKSSYKTILRSIAKQTKTLSVSLLGASPTNSEVSGQPSIDKALLLVLDNLVPSAGASYRQATQDLRGAARASYRGTATELREALREVLDQLAPDEEVMKAPGFKLEKDRPKPTMKQKARHILKARGKGETERNVPEKSIELIEEMLGALTRSVYDRASLSAHSTTTKEETQRIKRYVDTVLYDLLEVKESK